MNKLLSVREIIEWKVNKTKGLPDSVEMENKEEIVQLGWEDTDVLFSFLGIYAIGVWVYNKEKYCNRFSIDLNPNKILVLREEWKCAEKVGKGYKYTPVSEMCAANGGKKWYDYWQILGSKSYLLELQKQGEEQLSVDKLNKVMESFAEVYFDIGNVIPIWPGGNTLRGNQNNGFMDIPELFFHKYKRWYKVLIEQYKNAYLDYLKPENNEFDSLNVFLNSLKAEEDFENYVAHIVNVIKKRTEKIKKDLNP